MCIGISGIAVATSSGIGSEVTILISGLVLVTGSSVVSDATTVISGILDLSGSSIGFDDTGVCSISSKTLECLEIIDLVSSVYEVIIDTI